MSRVVVKFTEGITIPFENGELIGWEAHDRFVCALQMPLLGHQNSPLPGSSFDRRIGRWRRDWWRSGITVSDSTNSLGIRIGLAL